MHTGISWEAVN